MTSLKRLAKGLALREYRYQQLIPTNLLIFLTYRCTSRCKTCTMWRRKTNLHQELSLSELKRFVDMCSRWPIRHVEMFGGDALLRKDVLFDLTRYVKSKGIQVDLATNCNLLDMQTAQEIADAGFNYIYVSLDDVYAGHDEIRGREGSFRRVNDAIGFLQRARKNRPWPKVYAQCTVSKHNVEHLDEVLAYADENNLDVVAFEYVGEFPAEAVRLSRVNGILPDPYYVPQNDSTVRVNWDQARLLKAEIAKIKRRRKNLRVQVVTENIDILSKRHLVSGVCPHSRCYVCRYIITLDPYGNVIPCPFFNNHLLGNIREMELADIWGNERHLRFINAIGRNNVEMCKYCILSVERNQSPLGILKKHLFQRFA